MFCFVKKSKKLQKDLDIKNKRLIFATTNKNKHNIKLI